MKKIRTLRDAYGRYLCILNLTMIPSAIFFVIYGLSEISNSYTFGVILIILSIVIFIEYLCLRKYLCKKIEECTDDENEKN